jgi:oleate hydratase
MKAHLVGGGLASMAAAAYLIKDAGLDGEQITIYEEQDHLGGALHVTGSAESGYSFPGSRIFEWQYRCAMDLFAMVPSASDQSKSVKQEIAEFNERAGWYNKSRLVDHGARILSSTHLALTIRQKVQFIKLLLTPEFLLDGKQFKDCVSPDFSRQIFGTFGAP